MVPALAAAPLILAPDWAELPTDTQQILSPLGEEWNQLDSARKLKWLQIADRYPKMSKSEQERMQRRMKDWAKLTPQERKVAREKYRNVRQASPDQREALKKLWSEYQTLPDEEKQRLKQSATRSGTKPAPKPATGQPAIGGQPTR